MEGVRPPGYPSEYEVELVLADGREVSVRPILPSDAAELEVAFRSADSATLWMRFLGPPPELTPELLQWLTDVDYRKRFALVARDPRGHGIGVARWVAESDGDSAEVAVAVDPLWRRQGLAARLLVLMARAALERGIRTFTAAFAAANTPVAELVEAAGAAVRTTGGLVRMRMDLAPLAALGSLPVDEPVELAGLGESVRQALDVAEPGPGVLKGGPAAAQTADEPWDDRREERRDDRPDEPGAGGRHGGAGGRHN